MNTCKDCARTFGSQLALQQHRHSQIHALKLKCPDCNRTFGNQQAVNQHKRDSRIHNPVYSCQDCSRSFGSQKALDQHLQASPLHVVTDNNDDNDQISKVTALLKETYIEKSWCMYPELHERISSVLQADNLYLGFHHGDESKGVVEDYDTNVMGHFICQNKSCSSRRWRSLKIAIHIRLYSEMKYNARVYRQRCERCNNLGELILDESSYIERLVYRLKKWNGIAVETTHRSGTAKGPHLSDLCEGCKYGHCSGES